ncbi:MAG: hypothetical protein HN341_01130 [Verrucomicrobia bacterium]|jgi:hypothetical protein|nr:hypothetical protein [Verrucomicrobiota bacterium]
MLEGRVEHNTLIVMSIILCLLGALALTIGMFMYYGSEFHTYTTCFMTGVGALLLILGLGTGNYTKWRCRR